MPEMTQSEKINAIVKELIRTKIASDISTATKIAETLLADDARLSEGEKLFKHIIFNKAGDDFIKWFAGNKLEAEFKALQDEINALRDELAQVRKIAIQANEKSGSSYHPAPSPYAEEQPQQRPVTTAPMSQQQAKPQPQGTGSSGRAKRDEMNPDDFDINKIFYAGGKR